MSSITPGAGQFRTHVYGTVFGDRAHVLARLSVGDELILVPDPPGTDDANVWVHAAGGDVVGHLAPDINRWLVPWMLAGHRCAAHLVSIAGAEVASWKRVVIEVTCRT